MVYFIEMPDSIKIGKANNVDTRLRTFQTAHASTLKLLLVLEGSFELEQCLHDKFSAYHISGEHFRPSQEILDYIERHKSDNTLIRAKERSSNRTLALRGETPYEKWVHDRNRTDANKRGGVAILTCESEGRKPTMVPPTAGLYLVIAICFLGYIFVWELMTILLQRP